MSTVLLFQKLILPNTDMVQKNIIYFLSDLVVAFFLSWIGGNSEIWERLKVTPNIWHQRLCPVFAVRSTIRNAKSIHNKSRQRLSQDAYRRNSRRYLQQKEGRLAEPKKNSNIAAMSPLREKKNQGNFNQVFRPFGLNKEERARYDWTRFFVTCNRQTTLPSSLVPVRRASWRGRPRSSLRGPVQSSSWSAAATTPARKSASTSLAPAPPTNLQAHCGKHCDETGNSKSSKQK